MDQRKHLRRLQKNKQLYETINRYNRALQMIMTTQKDTVDINKLKELFDSTTVMISRETGVDLYKERNIRTKSQNPKLQEYNK